MAILPHDISLDTTVDNDHIQENDEALETALSNLTEANFTSATRIPNSKLENNDFTFNVVLKFRQDSAASGWVVDTTGRVQDATPMPYDSTEGNQTYTILRAIAVWRQGDVSATVPDFQVDWGYLDANGAWNQTTNIVASTAITQTDGTTTNGCLMSTLTLANSSITTSSSQERVFALRNGTTDAWLVAADGDFLTVTLKLKRELRS
jgi:hypothetical protein